MGFQANHDGRRTTDNGRRTTDNGQDMVLRDLILDTIRTLWSHKLRTFLTMFGIAWGIISITLMIAAGEGLRVGQMRQQETFAKDRLPIRGFSGQL